MLREEKKLVFERNLVIFRDLESFFVLFIFVWFGEFVSYIVLS